jgi:hypothetical protein
MDSDYAAPRVRRRIVAGVAALTMTASVLIITTTSSAASVPPGALHLHLVKQCPRRQMNPVFRITNRTNVRSGQDRTPAGGPETLDDVTIWRHGQQVGGPYTLAPGQSIKVTLNGVHWSGPFYARFSAKWRNQGEIAMDTRQKCACERLPTTTTTPTIPPTTTTAVTFDT